jgi:hypothetical protein
MRPRMRMRPRLLVGLLLLPLLRHLEDLERLRLPVLRKDVVEVLLPPGRVPVLRTKPRARLSVRGLAHERKGGGRGRGDGGRRGRDAKLLWRQVGGRRARGGATRGTSERIGRFFLICLGILARTASASPPSTACARAAAVVMAGGCCRLLHLASASLGTTAAVVVCCYCGCCRVLLLRLVVRCYCRYCRRCCRRLAIGGHRGSEGQGGGLGPATVACPVSTGEGRGMSVQYGGRGRHGTSSMASHDSSSSTRSSFPPPSISCAQRSHTKILAQRSHTKISELASSYRVPGLSGGGGAMAPSVGQRGEASEGDIPKL